MRTLVHVVMLVLFATLSPTVLAEPRTVTLSVSGMT